MADLEVDRREDSEELGAPVIAKSSSTAPPPMSSRSPSPPVPGPSGYTSDPAASKTDGKPLSYFAELDTVVEALQNQAQCLIDKINEKRSKDQILMEDFKTGLTLMVKDMSQCLEDRMYQLYEENTIRLQDKVQELTNVIDRIRHLQEELKQVCHTLTAVYKELGIQPEM